MENNNIENNGAENNAVENNAVENTVAENNGIENGAEVAEAVAAEVVEAEQPAAPVTEASANAEKVKALLNGAKDKGVSVFGKVVTAFKADPKKMGIRVGAVLLAAIVVVVGLFVGVGALTNNYKTPIKTMEKYANTKKYYATTDMTVELLNGFCEKETKALMKLYADSEDYEDSLEDAKDLFEDHVEEMKDNYGKNYKYSYKVIDKEKLDKDEIRDFRDTLRDRADSLETIIEQTEDYDSDDWEDMADNMGFDGSKSKAKAVISAMKDIRKVYKSAKVSAGYRLTVVVELTGSELDEPEENEREITVYKVNGRWITEDSTSLSMY